MKGIGTLVCTLFAFGAMGQTFEGKVVYSMEITGLPAGASSGPLAQFIPKQQISYYKNGAMRTETVGGMVPMTIVVPKTGEGLLYLNEDKKQALLMDKAQLGKSLDAMKGMKVTTKKTTATRTIAGHPCTKYMVTMTPAKKGETKMQTVVWAANNLKIAKPAAANPSNLLFKHIDGLPLITTVQQGPMNILLTATQVKAMPLSDSLFVKPAGYTQEPFSQEAIMKGLK